METSNLLIIGIIIAAILLIWIVYKNVMQDEKFIETEEYFIDNNESLVEVKNSRLSQDLLDNPSNYVQKNQPVPVVTEKFNEMVESHKNNLININTKLKNHNLDESKKHTNLSVKIDVNGDILSTTTSPSISY
jgi:hypothetical protein